MKRNQLNGAQKRKLEEENKQKTSEIFQNLPKLTSFFKVNPSEATSSLGSTDIVPKPVGVSETDPSSIGETNTIPEQVEVSDTVTDHPTPGADHLHTLRNDSEGFEDISKEILPDTNHKEAQSRKRIRKKTSKRAAETALNPRDKFHISTYYAIIDTLEAHMKRRGEVYKEVSSRFSFRNDMDLSDEQYTQGSRKLVDSYPVDLTMNLCGEVQQFHCDMCTKFNETGKMKFSHIDLHNTILKDGIQCVFPNAEIALRIFLTLVITNCSAECSFSQLKRIKNPQRTTMRQDRLDSRSLLCMEADVLRRVSFDELIRNCAIRKSRKKLF
ncbi:hypothetical protein KIL84_001545 [Mauremys mutica]|uniref:HAT C-terminal dimerisation domain-containing protein n=1 Tax=Mauremys mutica TaxID=74926 RepID=A0A9D3XIX9_9SAUR|nr:hypothetical protein KIL84_001545 [Mauremys mutica]